MLHRGSWRDGNRPAARGRALRPRARLCYVGPSIDFPDDPQMKTTKAARVALALMMLAGIPALAQDWPSKPVKLIVPFPPGGGTDTVARPLAAKLSQMLGQQFVIENRGGAGGTIGAAMAAKAAADGYTVLLYSVHGAVAASAYKNLSYDLEKDLVPVTTAAIFPDVLVAASRVPARTLPELIAYAKANPGKINCGSAGNGTSRHLACEMFKLQAGIQATHVP